jgi:hypothetical protein
VLAATLDPKTSQQYRPDQPINLAVFNLKTQF